MLSFGLLLAVVWGLAVAAFIQFTALGRFITARLTWLIVATGVGGDLLILLLLMDGAGRVAWWQVVAVIALSSVALVVRSLVEFYGYFRTLMAVARPQAMDHAHGDQDPAGE